LSIRQERYEAKMPAEWPANRARRNNSCELCHDSASNP